MKKIYASVEKRKGKIRNLLLVVHDSDSWVSICFLAANLCS